MSLKSITPRAALPVRGGGCRLGARAHGGEAPHLGAGGRGLASKVALRPFHFSLQRNVGVEAVGAAMAGQFLLSEPRWAVQNAALDLAARVRDFRGGRLEESSLGHERQQELKHFLL